MRGKTNEGGDKNRHLHLDSNQNSVLNSSTGSSLIMSFFMPPVTTQRPVLPPVLQVLQ